MQNEARITQLRKRSNEIAAQLLDTKRHDFDQLVSERNLISVEIKKLQEIITKKTYMEEISVRKWI